MNTKIKPSAILFLVVVAAIVTLDYFAISFIFLGFVDNNESIFLFLPIMLFVVLYQLFWAYPYTMAFLRWGFIIKIDDYGIWDRRLTKKPIPWQDIKKIFNLHHIEPTYGKFSVILISGKYAKDYDKTMFRWLTPFQESFIMTSIPLEVTGKLLSDEMKKYCEPGKILYGEE